MVAKISAIEKLEQQVREIVDYRTAFGKTAVERVQNLAGPRITALRNLITALKRKGITRLNAPLQFRFVGYERAAKHELIGQSIAHPKLRTVYRYSIHTSDTTQEVCAGRVAGVGQVGTLGEIEVGGTLKDEFPIFFPVFGDDRYEEFFSVKGREKRNEEGTQKVRKTMGEVVLEQLRDRGADIDGLKDYLREFFLEAARLDRGNDLLWLQRQFENDKIQDNTLATAYYDLMQNTSYSNESAVLVGNAVMELRKRSARGLIGRLRDDLLFLDGHREIHDPELDRGYTRTVYYPDKRRVAEGTLRDKLNEDSLTFAEALGIVRLVPGIAQVKTEFNRKNAEKYFGEGHKALTKALEIIDPVIEADKKACHTAKQTKGKANLQLGKNYKFAKETDDLSRLDDSKTRAANLIGFVGLRDSERTFSGVYTLANQLELARVADEPIQFTGVMATNYTNDIDFRERHKLDLADIVLRLNDVQEILLETKQRHKSPSKGTPKRKTDKGYTTFRENLERVQIDSQHHLVNVDFEERLARYGQVLAKYKENKGDTRKQLEGLAKYADAVDLRDSTDVQSLSRRKYLSDQEIAQIEEIRKRIHETEDIKKLRQEGKFTTREFSRLAALRRRVEGRLGPVGNERSVYSCQKGSLQPQAHGFFAPYSSIKGTNIKYWSIGEIEGRAKLVDRCQTGTELGIGFLDRLEAINANISGKALAADRSYRVGNLDLVIRQLKQRAERVLITDDFIAEVNVAYAKIQRQQEEPSRQYSSRIDPHSQAQLGTGRYYDVSVSGPNREVLAKTFSKSQGGVGYLRWDKQQGWYQTRISEKRLIEMMEKLSQRDPDHKVKVKLAKVYKS